MRLKEEPNEEIQLEKLYNIYQFESIEYFGVKNPIKIEWFSKNIHAVYKNIINLRKTEKKIRYVKGISLQDFPSLDKNAIDFLEIPYMCHLNFQWCQK